MSLGTSRSYYPALGRAECNAIEDARYEDKPWLTCYVVFHKQSSRFLFATRTKGSPKVIVNDEQKCAELPVKPLLTYGSLDILKQDPAYVVMQEPLFKIWIEKMHEWVDVKVIDYVKLANDYKKPLEEAARLSKDKTATRRLSEFFAAHSKSAGPR